MAKFDDILEIQRANEALLNYAGQLKTRTAMNLDLSKNTTLLENLSIVIPSLGGDDLESTLNTLTKYKYQPNEIIVSIPKATSWICHT